uniref:AGBL carboxypeptidase 4 n=1 Tax=Hucho hucho TaxID=62062 RepID=A0A4W5JI87_9TELE
MHKAGKPHLIEAGGEDALVGNVNKLMVTPTGYTGVPRKGHLVFDACFESGNLGRVDYISEFEFDLFIRPDTCNPRFRVWFNFTVENVRETQRVIFNIVNFSKTKSLYRDGMSPVVKSTSRPKWQRLPTKNVYYYRCPDHRRNYVMSFAFCFDREDDVYQFAYCYPYTYTRLQHYLDSLERRNLDYLQREQLGLSVVSVCVCVRECACVCICVCVLSPSSNSFQQTTKEPTAQVYPPVLRFIFSCYQYDCSTLCDCSQREDRRGP